MWKGKLLSGRFVRREGRHLPDSRSFRAIEKPKYCIVDLMKFGFKEIELAESSKCGRTSHPNSGIELIYLIHLKLKLRYSWYPVSLRRQ
jgi:hypothetical protein